MNMATVGEIIRECRTRAELSQDRLAALANISKVGLQNIETGKAKSPRAITLIAIARALGFDTWEGMIASVVPQSSSNGHAGRIPVLAKIPAGWSNGYEVNGAYDYEEAIDYLPMLPGITDKRSFALIVDGDSMSPRYAHGEIVVCSPRAWRDKGFEDGKRYAIRLTDGDTTIKRVHRIDDDHIELVPENERFPTRRINDADVEIAAVIRGRYIAEAE